MSVLLLPFLALSDQEDWTGARSATCCSCVFLLRFPSSDCVSVCNRDKQDYPAWLERYGEPEIVTTADHAAGRFDPQDCHVYHKITIHGSTD